MDWWNLMKQSVTVGAQLLWSGRYGCNKRRYGCTIVMSYIEINKAVSQWLLTFNLCVSVIWPLTCAFHIPCTHTPEIIDMHRGMCDNICVCIAYMFGSKSFHMSQQIGSFSRIFKKSVVTLVFWNRRDRQASGFSIKLTESRSAPKTPL